jgi:hypothetical protein
LAKGLLVDCDKFETLTVDGDAACCSTVLWGSGADCLQWESCCAVRELYRVFSLCVAGALYTECSMYVLQERCIQGVQFMCCRKVIYRVFKLCVAGTLYTGCSIYMLLKRYIQVFNLRVAGALYTRCSICVLQERYIQGV